MKRDLFALSIARGNEYSKLLTEKPEYRGLVTFAECKRQPIYNWFYYKEGYSGELVGRLLRELDVERNSIIIDPFCGTGNTLLSCKQRGYNAVGFDILPLGVFVSNTKLQEDYDMELLYEKIGEITRLKFGETALKWPDLGFIDVRKSFSRYARKDILFFKDRIMDVEGEKIRNFLLLGLLSIVIPASNIKRDGGVLKIVRKKHLPPVRHLLKNKLKRMYKDLKKSESSPEGISAKACLGDARSLELEQGSVDACITSPPYLNWVDYTKIYGFELALLADSEEIKMLRRKSMRSHVGAEYGKSVKLRSERIGEVLDKISESQGFVKHPQVVEGYFEDIYMSLRSIYGSLRQEGKAALVVGNVCLPGVTVDTDLILAELAEDVGFKVNDIMVANVRWCDVHGIRKERPVRESIVVLEK